MVSLYRSPMSACLSLCLYLPICLSVWLPIFPEHFNHLTRMKSLWLFRGTLLLIFKINTACEVMVLGGEHLIARAWRRECVLTRVCKNTSTSSGKHERSFQSGTLASCGKRYHLSMGANGSKILVVFWTGMNGRLVLHRRNAGGLKACYFYVLLFGASVSEYRNVKCLPWFLEKPSAIGTPLWPCHF